MSFGIWFLIGAAFVFFMQAGFAMVETGFTRAKNAGNILMKNLMDFCIGTPVFMFLGFGLLMGLDAASKFCGAPCWDIIGNWDAFIMNENGLASKFVFNLVFCATAATIVSGAMAERTRFMAYCIYSAIISLVVYPVEAGWVWGNTASNAWLTAAGFVDFAGSAAIHMVGGCTALIGAMMVGARTGKYERDENGKVIKVNAIQGHSMPLGALGCFILWFGWYGFNGAAATSEESIAVIFVNTTIAPSVATVTTMIFTWIKNKKPDVGMCMNASLAGLVGITAGCYIVSAIGAFFIGIVSGILVVVVIEFLDKKLHIDDPVGAIGVHLANGIWGTLAVGFFACNNYQADNYNETAGTYNALTADQLGIFYGGNGRLLGMQCLGIVTILGWTICTMTFIFFLLKYVPVMIKFRIWNPVTAVKVAKEKEWNGLRCSVEDEINGLDISEHALPSSYPDFVPTIASYDGDDSVPQVDISAVVPAEIELPAKKEGGRYTKVTVIANQEKFMQLKDAMAKIGVTGMTVTNVMGCGVQAGKTGQYRGVKTTMHLLPKVQVDIVVSTVDPKLVVAVAEKVLNDGKVGAGKIFVTDVENVMRIRTGETGVAALDNAK